MDKEYLGDSVYADIDGSGFLVLTTENGLPTDPSNTIFLEPEVVVTLLRFIRKHYKGKAVDENIPLP